MDDWKRSARSIQQQYYEKLGKRRWESFGLNQRWRLTSKVAFALCGIPTKDENLNRLYADCCDLEVSTYFERIFLEGYTEGQRKEVLRLCDKFYELKGPYGEMHVRFLFVVGHCDSATYIQPIFVLNLVTKEVIVDILGRVYKTWWDYTTNNKLPAGKVCYPELGMYIGYNGCVAVEYHDTPASSNDSKLKAELGEAVGNLSKVATGVGLLSIFFPIAAPIAGAAALASAGCGIYGSFQGLSELADRASHCQSVTDGDSLNCWLGLLGGILSVGSTFATKSMVAKVANSKVVNTADEIMLNLLNGGALVVNGVGILNQLVNLQEKANAGELTGKDILQFSTSLLFFANSAKNFQTASDIIKEVQDNIISNARSDLSKKREKAFDKVVKKSGGGQTEESKARIIKAVNNAGSKDEFYRKIIRAQKQSSSTSFDDKGNLVVNGKAYVDTDPKLQTHVRTKSNISGGVISKLNSNKIGEKFTFKNVAKAIDHLSKNHKMEFISLCNGVKIAMKKLYDFFVGLFKKYFFTDDKSSFPPEKVGEFVDISERFAQLVKCETESDFMDLTEFLSHCIQSKVKAMEANYQREKSKAEKCLGEEFNEENFARNLGVNDVNNRECSFQEAIMNEVNKSMNELEEKYEEIKKEISSINEDGKLKFISIPRAVKEYTLCHNIQGEELSPSEFFYVIRRVVEDKDTEKTPGEMPGITVYSVETLSLRVLEDNGHRFVLSVKLL